MERSQSGTLDDLDVAFAAIDIPDDMNFLSSSPPSSSQQGTGTYAANEGTGIGEGGGNGGDGGVNDSLSGAGGGGAALALAVHVMDLVEGGLEAVSEYHDVLSATACTEPPSPCRYSRSEAQQQEIDSFVSSVGGWSADGDASKGSRDNLSQDILLRKSFSADTVRARGGLLRVLRPQGGNDPAIGPIVLRREVVEKKGTEAVVKRTNNRELLLTTECLAVCKIVGRGKGSFDAAESHSFEPPSEGESSQEASLEVKQFENLHDLMLLDLTKTAMLKHPAVEVKEEGGAGAIGSAGASSGNGGASDASAAAVEGGGAGGDERRSRNPFEKRGRNRLKNWAVKGKSRASMVVGHILQKNSSSSSKGHAVGYSCSTQGEAVPSIMSTMPNLIPAALSSSLSKTTELSFALISPFRTYIFTCPNPTSHQCWVKLLSSSIAAAHVRHNSSQFISDDDLPVGWPHLISRTTAYTAAITNDLPMLHRTLTSHEVNKRDAAGFTPLHYSIMKGNSRCSTYLLDKSADPNTPCMSKCWTCLSYACQRGSINDIRLLIANGADVSVKDVDGRSFGHILTLGGGEENPDSVGILRLLTSYGLDINGLDEDGSTALHLAAENGLPRMVKCLVSREKIKGENLEVLFFVSFCLWGKKKK